MLILKVVSISPVTGIFPGAPFIGQLIVFSVFSATIRNLMSVSRWSNLFAFLHSPMVSKLSLFLLLRYVPSLMHITALFVNFLSPSQLALLINVSSSVASGPSEFYMIIKDSPF